MRKYILAAIFVLLVLQFIRPAKNLGETETPQDIAKVVKVPTQVMTVLKTACYDCHSNKTAYKWYHNVMPLGWWLNHHVKEGKQHLNFSEFGGYSQKRKDHKLEEVEEEVREHEMPLESYVIMHPEAKLSAEQITLIADWAKEARAQIK